jgi:hypothetical protein
MLRKLVMFALLLPCVTCGCAFPWQANNASQRVEVTPLAIGSGEPVFSPIDSHDMRTR